MNPGIPLLGGDIALVDDEDYDRVMAAAEPTWRHHQMRHVMYASTGHRQRTMHRVVLRLDMGGPAVDHINGDGLDNRKANLRLATNSQNQMNARKHGANATSSYKGVRLHEGKWQARIKINGVQSNLGHFDTPEVAADAYDLAALKAFGRYARLNRDERIAKAHDADVARRAVEEFAAKALNGFDPATEATDAAVHAVMHLVRETRQRVLSDALSVERIEDIVDSHQITDGECRCGRWRGDGSLRFARHFAAAQRAALLPAQSPDATP